MHPSILCTGMIAYAVLRWVGMPPEAARGALAGLRPVTAAGVKDERLAWADRFVARARPVTK